MKTRSKHFGHLLQHAAGELSSECKQGCPVKHPEYGGIALPVYKMESPMGYDYQGPDVDGLVNSMVVSGLLAQINMGENGGEKTYYPTVRGFEHMERHLHPVWTWFSENWLSTTVAGVAIFAAALDFFTWISTG